MAEPEPAPLAVAVVEEVAVVGLEVAEPGGGDEGEGVDDLLQDPAGDA